MQPTVAPPKKSLKFLWIVIPAVLLTVATFALAIGFIVKINDKTAGVDIVAVETAVKATSPNISDLWADVTADGFGHGMYVHLTFTTDTVSYQELESILNAAYSNSVGKVQNIQVRAVPVADKDKSIDLEPVADKLGIPYTGSSIKWSLTYSTLDLKERFGE